MKASIARLDDFRRDKPMENRMHNYRGIYSFGVIAATTFGVVEAVLIDLLEHRCRRYGKKHAGHYWFVSTYENWCGEVAFLWSRNKIINALKHLEDEKIIISGNFNEHKNNHTKWYRINHEAIINYEGEKNL